MATDEQRRRNIRLGLVLGSVALAFLIGYVIRMVLFGG
jgi:hypothetical protein